MHTKLYIKCSFILLSQNVERSYKTGFPILKIRSLDQYQPSLNRIFVIQIIYRDVWDVFRDVWDTNVHSITDRVNILIESNLIWIDVNFQFTNIIIYWFIEKYIVKYSQPWASRNRIFQKYKKYKNYMMFREKNN